VTARFITCCKGATKWQSCTIREPAPTAGRARATTHYSGGVGCGETGASAADWCHTEPAICFWCFEAYAVRISRIYSCSLWGHP